MHFWYVKTERETTERKNGYVRLLWLTQPGRAIEPKSTCFLLPIPLSTFNPNNLHSLLFFWKGVSLFHHYSHKTISQNFPKVLLTLSLYYILFLDYFYEVKVEFKGEAGCLDILNETECKIVPKDLRRPNPLFYKSWLFIRRNLESSPTFFPHPLRI